MTAEALAEYRRLQRLIQQLPTGFEWSALPKMRIIKRGPWVTYG